MFLRLKNLAIIDKKTAIVSNNGGLAINFND